jgi:hypothetical protein
MPAQAGTGGGRPAACAGSSGSRSICSIATASFQPGSGAERTGFDRCWLNR